MKRTFLFNSKNSTYIWSVELSLKYIKWEPWFNASWNIWWSSWQIIDLLDVQISSYCEQAVIDLRKEIKYIWLLYNNNYMHAWTKSQEAYLKKNNFKNLTYDQRCNLLRQAWLLFDDWYKYWSKRLVYQIPLDDLKRIENLFIRKPPRFVNEITHLNY